MALGSGSTVGALASHCPSSAPSHPKDCGAPVGLERERVRTLWSQRWTQARLQGGRLRCVSRAGRPLPGESSWPPERLQTRPHP